jgi:hypothetical protein
MESKANIQLSRKQLEIVLKHAVPGEPDRGLDSIHFPACPQGVRLSVSSDGSRLHAAPLPGLATAPGDTRGAATVPVWALRAALDAEAAGVTIAAADRPEQYTVEIRRHDDRIAAKIEGSALTFPAWEHVIPSSPTVLELECSIAKLRTAVRSKLSRFTPKGRRRNDAILIRGDATRAELVPDLLRSQLEEADAPSLEPVVIETVSAIGHAVRVAVSPEYFDDALRAIKASGSTTATVEIRGELEPLILHGEAGGYAIVMPRRSAS